MLITDIHVLYILPHGRPNARYLGLNSTFCYFLGRSRWVTLLTSRDLVETTAEELLPMHHSLLLGVPIAILRALVELSDSSHMSFHLY